MLQTVVMVLVLWAPWTPHAHEIDVLVDGTEVKTWALIAGPDSLDLAKAVNLPAGLVVSSVDLLVRNGRGFPNHRVMFFGLWGLGLVCWWMVGRFVDDVRQWRSRGELPPRRLADLLFGLIAVPSAIFLTLVYTIDGAGPRVLMAAGPIWVVVTYAGLWFRFKPFLRPRPPA